MTLLESESPEDWPVAGKMHFRLIDADLGELDLDCDHGYVVNAYDLGFPEVREVKVNNSLNDGTFDLTRYYGARAVTFDITLKSHTGLAPGLGERLDPEPVLRDRLLGFLHPARRPVLVFSEHTDPRVRTMLLRGSSASRAVAGGANNKMNVSWVAPRGVLNSYSPKCYRLMFADVDADTNYQSITINNAGSIASEWTATVAGELTKPVLSLDGIALQIDYDARPGDVVVLDSFHRTVVVNGKRVPYSYTNNHSAWFKVPPGNSVLTVAHDPYTTSGYPYAFWQEPTTSHVVIDDTFDRANGPLGAAWVTPAAVPAGTIAVPLAIASNGVVVTVADNEAGAHEWGFARNTAAITSPVGLLAEADFGNLAQAVTAGPVMQSHVELYTHMNTTDAACEALTVDFEYGVSMAPAAPIIFEDPFVSLDDWTVIGSGATIITAGHSGKGLQITGTVSSLTYAIDPADQDDTVVVGCYIRIVQTGTTVSSDRALFELWSGGSLAAKIGVAVGGSLYGTDAAGVNKAGSAAGTIRPNTWHYVEARYILSPSTGEYALRIDGVDVASAFNLNTRPASTVDVYDQLRIPPPNTTSGGTNQLDDVYLAVGSTAAFIGPRDVPNGSLAWKMHQYAGDGSEAAVAASGRVPYNYTATPVRLRLESSLDGYQRFLLDEIHAGEGWLADAAEGDLVGFGANWETFSYPAPPAGFTDTFERADLGADWVLPVARSTGKTVVLPFISAGAAVSAGHVANYPQYVYNATTAGATLVGGVAQNMPSSLTAGYLCIARVLQDTPNGVPITASTGWTQLGTGAVGTSGGDFMEAFDHFGAWNVSGTAAIVAGRTGNAAQLTDDGSSNHVDFPLRTPDATAVVGFAFQITSLAAVAELVQLYADGNTTQHNRVTVNTNGSLSFFCGSTSLGTTAAGLVAVNTWNYLEVRATLSDTVGAATLRLNGTDVLTLTAVDTRNAGTAAVYDTVRLCGPVSGQSNTFDDCYVLYGSAATFKGSQTIAVSSGTEFIRMTAFARIADGTSADNLTLTGAAREYVSQIESYWVQPVPPATQGGYAGSDIISQIKVAVASGVTPTGFSDPPSVALGAQRDWLFIVSAGIDNNEGTFPSMSQTSNYSSIGGTTFQSPYRVAMRSGYRTATQGGTEDPAAYTGTSGRPWVAFTIALPAGRVKWAGAEHITHEYDPSGTVTVEAQVANTATGGPPMVELYSHMVHGTPACRVLQADLVGRTWRLGHYAGVGDDIVAAASGSLPAGAYPVTLRLESDPDGTERFLFNGTLVQSVLDAGAPMPTGATRVGFGETWVTSAPPSPQVRSFTADGTRWDPTPAPPPPSSPRVERFYGAPVPGTNWAIPSGDAPNIQNYTPTKPRPTAPSIQEDEVPAETPGGSPLDDFRGPAPGMAIYDNGWVYDGYGWRNSSGQAITDAGVVIQTGTHPLNNPAPGGRPPWAWTPAVDPATGLPSFLTVNFCFYELWL